MYLTIFFVLIRLRVQTLSWDIDIWLTYTTYTQILVSKPPTPPSPLPGNVDPSFPGPALAEGGFQPVLQLLSHVLCGFFGDLAEMEGRR